MGGSPVRTTYPPTTITYIPANHTHTHRESFREREREWVIQHNANEVGITDIPMTETEVGGEVELDDAGGIVEKQAVTVGGDIDQNALQPGSLEENSTESQGVLRGGFSGVFQLEAHQFQSC